MTMLCFCKSILTIKAGQFTTFSPEIRDALMERPDVQVTVKWTQDGEDKKFVIKAGTDVDVSSIDCSNV